METATYRPTDPREPATEGPGDPGIQRPRDPQIHRLKDNREKRPRDRVTQGSKDPRIQKPKEKWHQPCLNENMFIRILLWYMLRFLLEDQRLLIKKNIVWTDWQFIQRA